MNKSIGVKKAFTLIEIIIVTLLILVVLSLVSLNFNFESEKKFKVELKTIKEFLLKNFKYEDKLSLICIEDEALDCYVLIDGNKNKNKKIENLFTQVPNVYNYDKDLSEYSFSKIRLDDIEYEPFFELVINSDKKHKNIVVDTNEEKVYLFSSLSKEIKEFSSTNEIIDRFFDLEIEVKDAF